MGTNSHPNPHPIGFLPAGTRVKCARCHPYPRPPAATTCQIERPKEGMAGLHQPVHRLVQLRVRDVGLRPGRDVHHRPRMRRPLVEPRETALRVLLLLVVRHVADGHEQRAHEPGTGGRLVERLQGRHVGRVEAVVEDSPAAHVRITDLVHEEARERVVGVNPLGDPIGNLLRPDHHVLRHAGHMDHGPELKDDRRARGERFADRRGEAGHTVEHDAMDADVGRHAACEPEEEVGDERRGRERRQELDERPAQEPRRLHERQVQRQAREGVSGLDALRQRRERRERERDEAHRRGQTALGEGHVARGGDQGHTEPPVLRRECRGEVEQQEHVALRHEREDDDVVAACLTQERRCRDRSRHGGTQESRRPWRRRH
jgi:hypothetical protein